MQVLNEQSVGLAGKTCSIVNLFLVVHKDHHIAAKHTQKILLWAPTRLLAKRRRSEKEDGLQATCNQDLIQHQNNLAKTQEKKACIVSSLRPQRAQRSDPGPLRLRIWSPVGSRPREACHRKILILGGIRALQIHLNLKVVEPEISLPYNDFTEK